MKRAEMQLQTMWVTVNGLAMRYRAATAPVTQNAPAIVLIHGLLVSDRYLLPTARTLAPTYRVYVPDLPGYGRSAKPDHALNIVELADATADWMRAIGLAQAIVYGNSLGCQIVAQLAVRHPELVQRVIFTGPTTDPQARTTTRIGMRWLANMFFEPLSLYLIIARDFIDIGLPRFLATFRFMLADHIEEQLPHIHVPTLVVRGSRDTVAPQRWTEEMLQLIPHARLAVIAKTGHAVNYNSPDRLASIIEDFLQDQDSTIHATALPKTS